jgi:GDPmannose 4,6-dehydratase
MRKALITGISGQDGSNLSDYLLSLGYEVHGIVRRNSTPEHQETRIQHLGDNIHTYYGDLSDVGGIERLLSDIQPDEIYNLAAQSHVRISFDIPQYTAQTNALGVLNILGAYKRACPKARFYQASSSEMFGDSCDDDGYQRETTPMHPVSPYGCAKLYGYHIVRTYRRSYGLHAVNGILFNHEGERRGSNFVTQKVCKSAVQIKLGLLDKLEMGNMDSYRDWGNSLDYVRAMHLILNHDIADDFVVSTGETHSVRDMCKFVFDYLGLNYEKYIAVNPKYLRPQELPYLKGDCSKLKKTFPDFKLQYTFEDTMREMVDFWLNYYGKK